MGDHLHREPGKIGKFGGHLINVRN